LPAPTCRPSTADPVRVRDDHFHNNTALDPMLVQIQGGQVKAIAPPESAEAKIVYPLPPLG
jgi:branched-chain amino acid transport system substrate-binding protein